MDAPFPIAGRPKTRSRKTPSLTRLPLAAMAALVCGPDLVWKSMSLHGADAVAIDTPSSLLRPLATAGLSTLALAGVLVLPRLCLPGVLLVLGGATSNLASVALWHGVPDPLGLRVDGTLVHFNLADTCVWSGCVLFLLAAYWTLWRLPAAEPGRADRKRTAVAARMGATDPPT